MKRKITFLALSLFAAVFVQAQSTNDVLTLLTERKVITQEDADSIRADAAIKQQESDAKKKSFPATASKPLQIAGYVQSRYQYSEKAGDKGGVDIRRARVDLKSTLSPYFNARIQADFAGSTAKLLDGYGEVLIADYFNLTIGQQKLPFSYENQISDNKSDVIDRSQIVEAYVARGKDSIGNHNGRDIGVVANGGFFKNANNQYLVEYFVGLFNGVGINQTKDLNNSKDFSARVLGRPYTGLTIGASYFDGYGYYGKPSDLTLFKNKSRKRIGAELQYEWDALQLRGEYIEGSYNGVKGAGYYAQVGYFILPDKLQATFKYDTFDPNTKKSDDANNWFVLGVNYLFSPNAKFQIAYTYKKEQGKSVDNNITSAQFQVSF
jgi:phosphate-selective porin OprO and OprP